MGLRVSPACTAVAAALALAASPALALFKVVGPDGRITYTDRPPNDASLRVSNFGPSGAASRSPEISLPQELREARARYPVVLYTAPDCAPCASGRQLLQQRGIPYAEKRVATEADAAALEELSGARTVPALTVGAQVMRGYAAAEWQDYLDLAGYPRQSRLPKGWPQPQAEALVPQPSPTPPAPPTTVQPTPALPPALLEPGRLRF